MTGTAEGHDPGEACKSDLGQVVKVTARGRSSAADEQEMLSGNHTAQVPISDSTFPNMTNVTAASADFAPNRGCAQTLIQMSARLITEEFRRCDYA